MMRQHLKTVGAALAQTGLLQQRKNPTHGVVVGAANNAHCGNGAALAQIASRASRQTRYAPAALCLRRRSLAHRWSPVASPAGRVRAHDQLPPANKCREGMCERTCARDKGRAALLSPSPPRIFRLAAVRPALPRPRLDQQTASLLAVGRITIDIARFSSIADGHPPLWERHGKIDHCRNADPGRNPDRYPNKPGPPRGGWWRGGGRRRSPRPIASFHLPTREQSQTFVCVCRCVDESGCVRHRRTSGGLFR